MNILVASILSLAAISAHADDYIQSTASYEAAIQGSFFNVTSSPGYVKIVIVNANTGEERQTCTTANLLAGAISLQYGSEFDATNFAMSNKEHRFVLSNISALKNIPISFTPQELIVIRERLSLLSNEELIEGFRVMPGGKLHGVFGNGRFRDAVACILIERGFSPYRGDVTGQVYIK